MEHSICQTCGPQYAAGLKPPENCRIKHFYEGSLMGMPGITLIRCGGHFDESAVLHWANGADGRAPFWPGAPAWQLMTGGMSASCTASPT